MFGAVDRPSKRALAEGQPRAAKMPAADFLRRVLAALPYQGHAVLADNGTRCPTVRNSESWR